MVIRNNIPEKSELPRQEHTAPAFSETIAFPTDNRRLPLFGAVNFRDLGGYPTTDHNRVRKGLVFRSDHLFRLTIDDQQLLQTLRFKTVCDLRTVREQRLAPDLLPEDDSIRLLSLPIQADGFDPATFLANWQMIGEESTTVATAIDDRLVDSMDILVLLPIIFQDHVTQKFRQIQTPAITFKTAATSLGLLRLDRTADRPTISLGH